MPKPKSTRTTEPPTATPIIAPKGKTVAGAVVAGVGTNAACAPSELIFVHKDRSELVESAADGGLVVSAGFHVVLNIYGVAVTSPDADTLQGREMIIGLPMVRSWGDRSTAAPQGIPGSDVLSGTVNTVTESGATEFRRRADGQLPGGIMI